MMTIGRAESPRTEAGAAAGMGVGMILLIVGGVAACVLCVPAILIALLVPALAKVREAAARTQATNNMRQIALACHSYHDAFMTLPSPRMQTADMSWRVQLLPFVEHAHIFNMMDQNAAWDNPVNAAFKSPMPNVYDFPADNPNPGNTDTKFQYFTGPNTMFPDPKARITILMITDGTSNTFQFAEAATPVPWMKPADMAITPNGPIPVPQLRFLAAMADGTVHIIDRGKVNDNNLRALITPAGGEILPPGLID